ncbi:chloroplast envelope membrane protein [Dorcoceras hygrometricum]|uniref:Chloroplast envelope membrane protein n=1 Tax=Dorcoceras hygrometricum TaxID=472368 RepID=A0A2Z7CVY1_9LAMI|nr:chloroplast envelope membrane protein [Dorcoceras hygrometricum]
MPDDGRTAAAAANTSRDSRPHAMPRIAEPIQANGRAPQLGHRANMCASPAAFVRPPCTASAHRDHMFIEGNLSSHKGWMSRFFYVRWVERKRNSWGCEMSWRDNVYTLTPSTPERSPNLISFLEVMREKCYNAPELVKEDLLCHCGFSRKGVELIGDLADRMVKTALLKSMKEGLEEGSLRAAVPPVKMVKKRKAPMPAKKEARRQKKKGASTFEARPAPTTETRRALMPPSSTTPSPTTPTIARAIPEDSLVVSPSGPMATGLLCNLIPNRDVARVRNATNAAVGLFVTQIVAVCSAPPELLLYAGTLTLNSYAGNGLGDEPPHRAQREVNDTRQHFDETLEHCTELEMRLADLEEARAWEERASEVQREVLEAQGQKLAAERAAMSIEKGKTAVEVELGKTKARAAEEIERLKGEATNAEVLGKEKFVNSSEFDDLCAKRSPAYFKSGIQSYVAQFRANGYSEEEHPAPFLSVAPAVEELPDDEEEADDGADEDASRDEATPTNSPEH